MSQFALQKDSAVPPDGRHAAIRHARQPLPAKEPGDSAPGDRPYRLWAAETCAAEARHAADDFWAVVHRLGFVTLFDRDDGVVGHEAPYRFPHEAHAVAALGWLGHLQAHESDRRGPWAAVRWNAWDSQQRREWFERRRYLWSGFVRQVERYREARRQLDSSFGAQCAAASRKISRGD
jgi:hypothetical protein